MISAKERAALETLWQRLRVSSVPDGAELEALARAFLEWAGHPQIEISKLADLRRHLRPGMALRTFTDLQVPIERALAKKIVDEHVIIDTDHVGAPRVLPLRLVLNCWRSAFNVGAIFRSAEGLGVEHIYLVGYTPTPADDKVAKSAMGAAVAWSHHEDLSAALAAASGFVKIAMETTTAALELCQPFARKPTLFVLGNERFGLSSVDLDQCDEVRRLSLLGVKNSLNVATLGAIALHEWGRQWSL